MQITLTGENDFEREQALKRITTDFVAKFGDYGLEKIDGEDNDYSQIHSALTNLPFLSTKKLIIFKNPSVSKDFVERYDQLLKDFPDINDLVLVEAKLDKRTAFYKYLQKVTDFHEFNPLDSYALEKWVISETKVRSGEINVADARYLIERAGNDQQKLSNEIDKLLAFDKSIKRENIDKLVAPTPQSKIFDLLSVAFTNHKRALELYREQRQLGEEPQKIIGMITWQLHLLALVKTAHNKSSQQIASEAKISPYSVANAIKLGQGMTLDELRNGIHDLLELDQALKTKKIDADQALEVYLMSL